MAVPAFHRAEETLPATDVAAVSPILGIASFPPPLATNPYQRLLYGELARHGFRLEHEGHLKAGWLWRRRRDVTVLHFHWPQGHFRFQRGPHRLRPLLSRAKLCAFGARLAFARSLGYRVMWTIHQVYPHELSEPGFERRGAMLLARMSHVLLAHEPSTAELAEAELGLRPNSVSLVPHGSYLGVYPAGRSRSVVRDGLRIPAGCFMFLSFGNLRAYKEIELLLRAFAELDSPDVRLVVAGTARHSEGAAAVRKAARNDPRITALLDYIPDDAVAELFAACDAAVVARGDGGTSGALVLALSLGLPVVAARTPAYEALVRAERAGWLFEPGNVVSLREALERAAADSLAARRKGLEALRVAQGLSWSENAERTASLIAATLTRRRG
jgi:beta-1,4-mannosyltransferase